MQTRTRVACLGTVALVVISTSSGSGQGQPAGSGNSAKRLIGTWRLVSYLRNGQPLPNEGLRPIGLIYYDATGHMAAQVMPDRVRPGWTNQDPTPDEAKAAILGYVAYFGTYSVNERDSTVTHHRLGRLNPGGSDEFVRRYEFLGEDRLRLTLLPDQGDRLIWERVK